MSDRLTILRCSSNLVMSKRWRADGTIQAYDSAKNFQVEDVAVDNIYQLSAALSVLETEPQACIIRGRPKPDLHLKQVRRLIENFDDIPLHSILIEVDAYKPLLSDPVHEPTDAALEYIAECLPAAFQDTSFHWQLSNSAGAPGKESIFKAHLWFYLHTPYDSATLRAWAKAEELQLDRAVLQIVQCHFTANPVFDPGVTDPVPQRSGLCYGKKSEVSLHIDTDALTIRTQGVRQRGETHELPEAAGAELLLSSAGSIAAGPLPMVPADSVSVWKAAGT